jgi:uncharacterized membrane protein
VTTTLSKLGERIDVPTKGTVVDAPIALTSLVMPLGGPARRLIVGTISGTLSVVQLDGTTLTWSEAHLKAVSGVVDHVAVAIQSAACTDILAQR